MIVILLLAGVSALAVINADKFEEGPVEKPPVAERRK